MNTLRFANRGRLWEIAIFFMGVTVGVTLLVPIILTTPSRPQSEPVVLISSTYKPQAFCPGDTVPPYELAWRVRRPSILFVTVAYLRGNGGDTIIGMKSDPFITNIPTERVIVDRDESFTIPPLPPGIYERVLGIGTMSKDSEPVFFSFRFGVRDDCDY